MNNIQIDFDVFKTLTNLRNCEEDTYNDVLRRLLNLKHTKKEQSTTPRQGGGWTYKSVDFPEGTKFRTTYKGKKYYGLITNGKFIVEEKEAFSPSDAAHIITGNSVNGWSFWECKRPSDSHWYLLSSLRRK